MNKDRGSLIRKKDFIRLSLPLIGTFYAMFRMLFKINYHFNSRKSFFGLQFWKFWFSGMFIMLMPALPCVLLMISFYHIIGFENTVLMLIFASLLYTVWGFGIYFMTNFF